jgi:Holliday junction DNA helicase RuvA
MIGRLAGRLDWKGADQVLIDVRGVGYLVTVSERTLAALPPPGAAATLWTDLLVREDLLQLYGFATLAEREWHRLLMTVQGVGARASLAMLGVLGAEGVARAVMLGDARAIQAAPGVGPKLAGRIVLELKAKAPVLMAAGGRLAVALPAEPDPDPAGPDPAGSAPRPPRAAPPAATAPPPRAADAADALSALVNLGYGQGEAAAAVAEAAATLPEADTAGLIRAALKRLAPR